MMQSAARRRGAESLAYAAAGGVLAGVMGTVFGAPLIAAGVGTANGAIAGWHRIHDVTRRRSVLAFVLDSTWSLPSTAGSLVSHVAAWMRSDRGGRSAAMSVHQDRHVYATGLTLRRGFALTVGNVISGAGPVDDHSDRARRRRELVDRHEDLHVWQARALGPVYPVMYAAWMVGGAVVGITRWIGHRDHRLVDEVESAAYYANPFEWWAYSRDGNWPPRGALPTRVWRRPWRVARHAEADTGAR